MRPKRDYGQFCGLAAGLNVIGERWTFLIIRELLIGPARFSELTGNLPGIGQNLLSDRLQMLIESGVVERTTVAGDGRGRSYQLTEFGVGLREPILLLARWGMNLLSSDDSTGSTRAEWGFFAVQAMIVPSRIPRRNEVYAFLVEDEIFSIRVHNGVVGFERSLTERPVLRVTADARTFIKIGARMIDPVDAMRAGMIDIAGSPDAIRRCTAMLGLHERSDTTNRTNVHVTETGADNSGTQPAWSIADTNY